jgi:hypothetical protein
MAAVAIQEHEIADGRRSVIRMQESRVEWGSEGFQTNNRETF